MPAPNGGVCAAGGCIRSGAPGLCAAARSHRAAMYGGSSPCSRVRCRPVQRVTPPPFGPCLPHRMRRMRMLSRVSAGCRVRMRPQDPFCSCRTPWRGCSLCARPLRGWCSRWISFRTIGKGNRGQRYDFSGFCNSENRVIFVSGIRHKREPTMKTRRFWSLCLILSALLFGSCAVHRPPGPRPPRPPHEAPPPPHHGPKRPGKKHKKPKPPKPPRHDDRPDRW